MARRKVDVLSPLLACRKDRPFPNAQGDVADCECLEGECVVRGACLARVERDERGSVLDEAAGIVHGARQEAYGHPRDNHACTAQLWTAYLRRCGVLKDDAEITPRQVCIANALQKCSRDAHEEKRDNLVDLAGWAANAEMVDE